MEFFAKSKTFLIGEYSVLFKGSAIVLTTHPDFCLKTRKSENTSINGIDESSPAFSFYLKHINLFQNISINFLDPHNGTGGFGASSAQFTLLYKLYLSLTHKKFEINNFLEIYKITAGTEGKISPSGADCLAQFYNQHLYFNATTNDVSEIQWNFPNIVFSVFKTTIKIPTHSHILQLDIQNKPSIEKLGNLVEDVKHAILTSDHNLFCYGMQSFYDSLCNFGLVIDNTQKIIHELLEYDYILAAKGCGAMGADTILIIHDKKKSHQVSEIANSLNLKPIINILT